MVGSTLMILLVILVFFTAQHFFIQGIAVSGIKGCVPQPGHGDHSCGNGRCDTGSTNDIHARRLNSNRNRRTVSRPLRSGTTGATPIRTCHRIILDASSPALPINFGLRNGMSS